MQGVRKRSVREEPLAEDVAEQSQSVVEFTVLRFQGWEVTFEDCALKIANDAGLEALFSDISQATVSVHVHSSGLQIRSRSFPVEVRIEDESVRDWIVRFLHYWGFPIVGIRIEQGVLIPTHSESCRK
jgi:hypothetical protein